MPKNFDFEKDALLGIDFGKTNTGLALGRNGLVVPLEIISGKNIERAINQINRQVIENKVVKIIVGLPLSFDNKETVQSMEVRKFAKQLKILTKKPVEFQNEYASSREALEEAVDLDIPSKKRKTNDHLAAALILDSYYKENYTF